MRRPVATLHSGTHRDSPAPSTMSPRTRGMAAIITTSTSNTRSFVPLDVRSFPADCPFPSPVLRPLLTSARSAVTSRPPPSARRPRSRQAQPTPDRSPQVRTITFPLLPPRLPDSLFGDDGLHLPLQAHPGHPASYAIRIPRCRDSPRASSRPRLTTTPLPPARS
jgi:hypothetical protein